MAQHKLLSSSPWGCPRLPAAAGAALRHAKSATCRSIIYSHKYSPCLAKAAPDSSPADVAAEPQSSDAKVEELEEKERLRRERISSANAGKAPWNKGRKHSPETIAKIRERTRQAMLRSEVVDKIKEARSKQRAVGQGVKERIRATLLAYHATKRIEEFVEADTTNAASAAASDEAIAESVTKPKRHRSSTSTKKVAKANAAVKDAAAADAAEAEPGSSKDMRKPPPSPLPLPVAASPPAAAAGAVATATLSPPPAVLPKPRRKAAATTIADAASGSCSTRTGTVAVAPDGEQAVAAAVAPQRGTQNQDRAQGVEEGPRRRSGQPVGAKRSPEHRAAIAEAIRRKWQDPAYRASAIAGIRRAAGSDAGSATAGSGDSARRRQPPNRAKLPEETDSGRSSGAASGAASGGSRTWASPSSNSRSWGTAPGKGLATAAAVAAAAEGLPPLTVRSSRAARGGIRRGRMPLQVQDGSMHSKNSSSSSSGAGTAVGSSTSGSSDGAAAAAAAAAAGGDGSSKVVVSPTARLAAVQRLVHQVLRAECLVANTENLLRQFSKKRHALRNDLIIQPQADEQLRSVTATLQQAKVKLELLRARVPPDARYNDKGDVWFAPMASGVSTASQTANSGSLRCGAGASVGAGWGAGEGVEALTDEGPIGDGISKEGMSGWGSDGNDNGNSSSSSGGSDLVHDGASRTRNGVKPGTGQEVGDLATRRVVDVEGRVVGLSSGLGLGGEVVVPRGGEGERNEGGYGGSGVGFAKWRNSQQQQHQYHLHDDSSSNRIGTSHGSASGNGFNGLNGLHVNVESFVHDAGNWPIGDGHLFNGHESGEEDNDDDDLDDEDDGRGDEDEDEDEDDGFWWNFGGWGRSPPSGRSPNGPGSPNSLGAFADLASLPPGEAVQVDLASLDALNSLLLRPVNGHTVSHHGAAKTHGSSTSAAAGPIAELPGGCQYTPAATGANDDDDGDGGGGAGGGGGGGLAAAADSMPGASPTDASWSSEDSCAGRSGALAAAGGHISNAESSEVSGPGLGATAAEGPDLAQRWLGTTARGVRTLEELNALLPESHSWLKELIEGQQQQVGEVWIGSFPSEAREAAVDAAEQKLEALYSSLEDRPSAVSEAVPSLLPRVPDRPTSWPVMTCGHQGGDAHMRESGGKAAGRGTGSQGGEEIMAAGPTPSFAEAPRRPADGGRVVAGRARSGRVAAQQQPEEDAGTAPEDQQQQERPEGEEQRMASRSVADLKGPDAPDGVQAGAGVVRGRWSQRIVRRRGT